MTAKTPVPEKKKSTALRTPDPGNLMLLVYTLSVLVCILVGGVLRAEGAESPGESVGPGDLRQGELIIPDRQGNPGTATLLHQNVNISISGIAARVTVAQEFMNTGQEWVNGLYVFPLPDESAVDRLRMKVGAREIIGEIREKEEAAAIYKKAAEQGKKSSLLAQNRPNIFTTRIANIGPGETITVIIEYQQLVQLHDNVFSLRFPMAITPRYIPGHPVSHSGENSRSITFDALGWAQDTDQVPDASQITPPVIDGADRAAPKVELSVNLASGFALSRLDSLYHEMDITETSTGNFSLAFNGNVLADRDFVLEWVPENSHTTAALFSEQKGEDNFMLLMLMPSAKLTGEPVAREVIFILDVSGSMAGPSIRQAKEALRRSLSTLRPVDRFNIISFNNSARSLFSVSRPGTGESKEIAEEYLTRLQAEGGTEVKSALDLALDGRKNHERIRQVVFLTDGAVGNEGALLKAIDANLGDSRLFTVGIGAAPNSYFMTRAASVGRGSFTYIGDIQEVERKVAKLLARLENPVITDIRMQPVSAGSGALEFYPDPVPDLYHGEPLMLAMKVPHGETGLRISGYKAGTPVDFYINTSGSGSRPGIGVLWARKKIRNQMESLALGADEKQVKEAITTTALKHQIVSKYTSLVAVDTERSRPENQKSGSEQLRSPLPRDLRLDAVFGGGSRTATPSPLLLVVGSCLLGLAALLEILKRLKWARF